MADSKLSFQRQARLSASSSHGKRYKSKETSEVDRGNIRALANTGMSRRNISNLLHLTERQVQYALK
ncbi:hypothetical protein GcM1_142006 [Golovinomyces cichoracearum]|uniref:Uncharacterized protein n=1 Tax=Golovinomyces cichoracearum TaxID=62708 RepID=A0A420JBR5_9PEZI|nr:hypothetical protein GcM1_142006 [Golovinomyces cichoracearum]